MIFLHDRAVAARETAANKPPPIGAASAATPSAPAKAKPTAAPAKKDPKKSLKGVLVKKKAKPTTSEAQQSAAKEDKVKADERTGGDEREAKRRKMSTS